MTDAHAGLYLHVPFCAQVCPYCDFAVRTGDRQRRARFVDHLLREIELYADYPLTFDTIYFGGGTPSALKPGELSRIVDRARARLGFSADTRLFLEVNPEDVDADSVAAWRRLGVETLSLGLQSLDDRSLAFLGRRHSADEGRRSVERALAAGFSTVSVDLIYGLPDQTTDDWKRELDAAIALGVQHISCYQLTIHERTRFALLERRGQLTQLPLDGQADLFGLVHRHLNDAGMQGYEVSQFACSEQHRSRHNLKYWDHTPYVGLGPSAHSFHDRRRWWNIRRTDAWQERVAEGTPPVDASENLEPAALALEVLMIGLRTYAGVDLVRLRSLGQVDLLEVNRELVEELTTDGLLSIEHERLVPTLDGLAIADALATRFELS